PRGLQTYMCSNTEAQRGRGTVLSVRPARGRAAACARDIVVVTTATVVTAPLIDPDALWPRGCTDLDRARCDRSRRGLHRPRDAPVMSPRALTEWALQYTGWDPAAQPLREALTALGNGYLVTRGAAEEASAGGPHYPGTYLAGGYDRLSSEV